MALCLRAVPKSTLKDEAIVFSREANKLFTKTVHGDI